MSQHTPAHWVVFKAGNISDVLPAMREGAIAEAIVNDADARLIAAAPDLLKALGRMVAEFGDYHYEGCPADWIEGHENHGPCNCFAGALLRDALDVLIKAEDTP